MYTSALIRSTRQLATKRTFATSVKAMAAGDTGSGAARIGGMQGGDSFTKREKASEDLFIRQQEKDKLRALKERLAVQRKHIDELDKHIDELVKGQGGENN